VDTLVEADQIYRQLSDNPWDLQICGMGPLATLFQDQAGITDHGFLQPEAMRLLMVKSGTLVLSSRFDPWPLIVVEAAAAGLPLLVSESCGSAVELLRPGFNGIFVPPKTTASKLADSMLKLSSRRDLVEWGARSRLLAEAYKAETWADRWLAIVEEIGKGSEC
ncbi:MAG: glycosyltransferase, partial [Chthoniobacterales bacterium]